MICQNVLHQKLAEHVHVKTLVKVLSIDVNLRLVVRSSRHVRTSTKIVLY